jgi:hypothetical protein
MTERMDIGSLVWPKYLTGFLSTWSLWHCATRLSPREGNREAHDSMNSLHLQTLKTLLGVLYDLIMSNYASFRRLAQISNGPGPSLNLFIL